MTPEMFSICVLLIGGTLHVNVNSETVERLWPVDSQTCESEVHSNVFQPNQDCSKHTFQSQPPDFPFRAMVFDGSIYIDKRVDLSKSNADHYSVQALVYITGTTGMLFHYKADQANREAYLMIENNKIKIYRMVRSSSQSTKTGSMYLNLNTWYYISLGVGRVGYFNGYINGTRDIYGLLGNRNSPEVPGNLRIGGHISGSQPGFQGRMACVAFHWLNRKPTLDEIHNLCSTTPWMPLKPKHRIYLSHKNDPELFPGPLTTVTRCSLLQCTYACLREANCYHVYYDKDSDKECKTCYMYNRVETTANTNQTLKLYTVKL